MAKTLGWVTGAGEWVYQRWRPEQKRLTVGSRRKALPQDELMTLIHNIQTYIHRDTLSVFHATRQLEEQMKGETVRLLMDVAFRAPEANALYDGLNQQQGNAALQVAGIQFWRESRQRPPTLQQLMALSWGHWSSITLVRTALLVYRMLFHHSLLLRIAGCDRVAEAASKAGAC
eukprot:s5401_g9.t1